MSGVHGERWQARAERIEQGRMRVLVDCRYVRPERHDGISRFTAEIVRELASRCSVLMLIDDPAQLAQLPSLPFVLGPSHTGVLEPLTSLRLRQVAADVVFSPMQTIGSVGRRWPLVTTVHDLIYYAHPEPPRDLPAHVRLAWRLYHRSFVPQRVLLQHVDGVATVSQTTADLVRAHHLTTKPLRVVANAANPLGTPVDRQTPAAKRLVYMGSFMPYKGVETLIAAMHQLPDYTLDLLSRISDGDRARLEALAPAGRVTFHGGVTDDEYAEILRNATALVHASRDEGFGIPLLEAMALGIPVVVSDIPIFREVAGDAAAYFPVGDADELARQVRALEADGAWAHHSALSRQAATRFDWARSADALVEFLGEIALARA